MPFLFIRIADDGVLIRCWMPGHNSLANSAYVLISTNVFEIGTDKDKISYWWSVAERDDGWSFVKQV